MSCYAYKTNHFEYYIEKMGENFYFTVRRKRDKEIFGPVLMSKRSMLKLMLDLDFPPSFIKLTYLTRC